MRKILIACYIVLLIAFTAPALMQSLGLWDPAEEESGAGPAPSAAPGSSRSIRLLTREGVLELDMEEYMLGVVAAEMPASFPAEALKAQAVAARSYTLYCAAAQRHGQAEVCANSGCCQAWMDEAALRERWGSDYERYRGTISAAVQATAGESLSYEGQLVCAVFHSSSAGATEASESVWSASPYLVSVSSPETEETVPGLISQVELSPADFAAALLEAKGEADFSQPPESWIGECRLSPSGRVYSMVLGGQAFSGGSLRGIFSLRSTDFELSYTGQSFLFTVYGYGHGIGMSQYGAKLMAEEGADYVSILAHYYPGTELIK